MAEPLSLARYHDAVISALKQITWVSDAGAYPEKNIPRFTGLVTPAVYFTINSWEQNGGNEGQLNVELSCDLYVVVDAASGLSCPEIFLRTAAADITQWIDGQQFGLTHISPAVFTAAERDEFDPRMDDYLVWRVSFTRGGSFWRGSVRPHRYATESGLAGSSTGYGVAACGRLLPYPRGRS